MAGAIHILPGKLNRPHLDAKTVVWPRLYQQIDQSLSANVTTIVAPAGFGKTVLLTGWMAQCPMPVAWLVWRYPMQGKASGRTLMRRRSPSPGAIRC